MNDLAALKSAALADRAAAILADDGVAQREAEQSFNAVLEMEARARKLAGIKARIRAEENAKRAGYDAGKCGVGPEGVLKIAKSLRAHWEAGWNAYWTA